MPEKIGGVGKFFKTNKLKLNNWKFIHGRTVVRQWIFGNVLV